jgi:hypothetical protein
MVEVGGVYTTLSGVGRNVPPAARNGLRISRTVAPGFLPRKGNVPEPGMQSRAIRGRLSTDDASIAMAKDFGIS